VTRGPHTQAHTLRGVLLGRLVVVVVVVLQRRHAVGGFKGTVRGDGVNPNLVLYVVGCAGERGRCDRVECVMGKVALRL